MLISTFVLAEAAKAYAATARATINSIDVNGVGPVIGTVTFKDTNYGLVVTPDISDLLSAFMVSTFMTKVHAGLQNMKAR